MRAGEVVAGIILIIFGFVFYYVIAVAIDCYYYDCYYTWADALGVLIILVGFILICVGSIRYRQSYGGMMWRQQQQQQQLLMQQQQMLMQQQQQQQQLMAARQARPRVAKPAPVAQTPAASTEMKYCSSCGAEISKNAKFCGSCGATQ